MKTSVEFNALVSIVHDTRREVKELTGRENSNDPKALPSYLHGFRWVRSLARPNELPALLTEKIETMTGHVKAYEETYQPSDATKAERSLNYRLQKCFRKVEGLVKREIAKAQAAQDRQAAKTGFGGNSELLRNLHGIDSTLRDTAQNVQEAGKDEGKALEARIHGLGWVRHFSESGRVSREISSEVNLVTRYVKEYKEQYKPEQRKQEERNLAYLMSKFFYSFASRFRAVTTPAG